VLIVITCVPTVIILYFLLYCCLYISTLYIPILNCGKIRQYQAYISVSVYIRPYRIIQTWHTSNLRTIQTWHTYSLQQIQTWHISNLQTIQTWHNCSLQTLHTWHTSNLETVQTWHTSNLETVQTLHITSLQTIRKWYSCSLQTLQTWHNATYFRRCLWTVHFSLSLIVSEDYSIYSKHLECRNIKYRLSVFSLEPNFAICCIEYQVCPFVLFSFDHCVVCSPSIYGFWISLWYLQTLLLVVFYIAISINLDILSKIKKKITVSWFCFHQVLVFPILWFWPYLIKIIPETRRVYQILISMFSLNTSVHKICSIENYSWYQQW
jgi:hypothetical protein